MQQMNMMTTLKLTSVRVSRRNEDELHVWESGNAVGRARERGVDAMDYPDDDKVERYRCSFGEVWGFDFSVVIWTRWNKLI